MSGNTQGVIPNIAKHSKAFAASFIAMFMLLFVFLAAMDALPDPSAASAEVEQTSSQIATIDTPALPVRVKAKDINLDVQVHNPTSTNVDALDQALLSGAARYPTSAKLGEIGTVLLFGHSSYLPIVHNQAYKAFDGIQNLKTGQIISVYSASAEYRYKVVGVRLADATQDVVELASSGKHLTLVTCDSFSKKTDRFVVTADFVGTYALASN